MFFGEESQARETRSSSYAPARVLMLVALAAAAVVVALLMFGAFSERYQLTMTLDNASQLVTGNEIKAGGKSVGKINEIELNDSSQVKIKFTISDSKLEPLHEGTTMIVRSTSLSGIANRYVALQPGPNDAPEIPNGGSIPVDDAQSEVDLDEVLNTLDPGLVADLQTGVRRSADIFDAQDEDGHDTNRTDKKAIADANAALLALNPALSQGSLTVRELLRDERLLERFVVDSADFVSQVAEPREDLEQLSGNALSALGAVAQENEALDSILAQFPPTLRKTNTSLVNLRATLDDLRPAIAEARPTAPRLSGFLTRLRPVARDARPLIADLRRTIDRPGRSDDLIGVLRGLDDVAREGVPALESSSKLTDDALPIARDARPYVPDLIGGFVNGFGGTAGGYYDANGHYARISAQASVYSQTGGGSLIPLPEGQRGLTGYRKNLDKRCPGASTQPLADGSNPFRDGRGDEFPCDIEDSSR